MRLHVTTGGPGQDAGVSGENPVVSPLQRRTLVADPVEKLPFKASSRQSAPPRFPAAQCPGERAARRPGPQDAERFLQEVRSRAGMRRDLLVEDRRGDERLAGGGRVDEPADSPAAGAVLSVSLPAAPRPSLSIVMPTVSWTGTFAWCVERCLDLVDAGGDGCELVVVYDGVAPPPPSSLERPGVTVLETGERGGPARARNLAAEAARGEILLFVDADVELAGDVVERVRTLFACEPDRVAVFGTYDDEPRAEGTVSQFRNLLHHHTHVAHAGRAGTFWSGCGAIRTASFLDLGGFDEGYRYPSVEDIELGMRVVAAGGRIDLDPSLRCKHAKAWSLGSMIYTDIVHRARPWTHLIAASHSLPDALNIDWRGRASGVCAVGMIVALAAGLVLPAAGLPAVGGMALACLLSLVVLNADFYRLCLRKRGARFAVASVALHWLYYVYSSITFGVVMIQEALLDLVRPVACHESSSAPSSTGDTAATIGRPRPITGR
jgi:GT2 family glycosyltransferase